MLLIVGPNQAAPNYFTSVQDAINAANPGDVVAIIPGVYELSSKVRIAATKNITVTTIPMAFGQKSTDNDAVTLIGNHDDTYVMSVADSDNIEVSGITLTRNKDSRGSLFAIKGNHVTLRAMNFFFSPESTVRNIDCVKALAGTSYLTITECEFDGGTGEADQAVDCITTLRVSIQDNTVRNIQNAFVIKAGSYSGVIENNVIYDTIHGAIGLGGMTSANIPNDSNYEIASFLCRNNLIHLSARPCNNIGGGIFAWGAMDCIIEDNTVVGPGIHVRNGGDPNNPTTNSRNVTIRRNTVLCYGNDMCLRVDSGQENIQVEQNRFWMDSSFGSKPFLIEGSALDKGTATAQYPWFADSNVVLDDPERMLATSLFENTVRVIRSQRARRGQQQFTQTEKSELM